MDKIKLVLVSKPVMHGVLTNKQLSFFYYGIAYSDFSSAAKNYEWSDEVDNFLNNQGIKVFVNKNIPSGNPPKDVIYFSKGLKESKQEAFFRHMRNAFAHFLIFKHKKYVTMRDIKEKKDGSKKLTMVCNIKYEDLIGFYIVFFKCNELLAEAVRHDQLQDE